MKKKQLKKWNLRYGCTHAAQGCAAQVGSAYTHLVLRGREPPSKLFLQALQRKVNQAVVQELRHLEPAPVSAY